MSERSRNEKLLSGRVAIVTGASRRAGIGYTLARKLGSMGADVFLQGWRGHDASFSWGEDPDSAESLVEDLRRETGAKFEYLEADFTDPDAPEKVVRGAVDAFGRADILIANHARGSWQELGDLTAEEIDTTFAVNARATMLLVQSFASHHDGERGGRVVLFTSGQHLGPMPDELPYAVSKGAIHQMTRSFASPLIRRDITLNTVNPGPTDNGAYPEEMIKDTSIFPQGRWGSPEDVANLVGWLCTDEAGWVVGQVINSEGGFRM